MKLKKLSVFALALAIGLTSLPASSTVYIIGKRPNDQPSPPPDVDTTTVPDAPSYDGEGLSAFFRKLTKQEIAVMSDARCTRFSTYSSISGTAETRYGAAVSMLGAITALDASAFRLGSTFTVTWNDGGTTSYTVIGRFGTATLDPTPAAVSAPDGNPGEAIARPGGCSTGKAKPDGN